MQAHLEAAANAGAVPHLCRFVVEQTGGAAEAGAGGAGLVNRLPLWPAFRGFVVPMLVGMVTCSSSTRSRLWATNGPDVFLHLLADDDHHMQIGKRLGL